MTDTHPTPTPAAAILDTLHEHLDAADQSCTRAAVHLARAKNDERREFWRTAHAENVAAWGALQRAVKAAEALVH